MDGVLGDDRRDLLGDVFDHSTARAFTTFQLPALTRTDIQAALDTRVVNDGRFGARSFVTDLRARFFPETRNRRFFIHRDHVRGRGNRRRGSPPDDSRATCSAIARTCSAIARTCSAIARTCSASGGANRMTASAPSKGSASATSRKSRPVRAKSRIAVKLGVYYVAFMIFEDVRDSIDGRNT